MWESPTTYRVRHTGRSISITVQIVKAIDSRSRAQREVIAISSQYHQPLIDEIKLLQGATWVPGQKVWQVSCTQHNIFQLKYMLCIEDPYADWDYEPSPTDFQWKRPLMEHQKFGAAKWLMCKRILAAYEPGLGKSLMFLEALEKIPDISRPWEVWYVGPNSAVESVKREMRKWSCMRPPNKLYTFEKLKSYVSTNNWDPPRVLIVDESHNVKTPNAQRSIAVKAVADAIRSKWGDDGYILLLTGTPAPKTPLDWWHQVEIVQPGFILEGSQEQMRKRLAITVFRDNQITGGQYRQLVTWLDDERKCKVCGTLETNPNAPKEPIHTNVSYTDTTDKDRTYHPYQRSKNEVHYLSERLKGLVLVRKKKDCLDLPEKTYEQIKVRPTADLIRKMNLIKETSPRAIQALERIRELSDGFQYVETEIGEETCPTCSGKGEVFLPADMSGTSEEAPATDSFGVCPCCSGKKTVKKYGQTTVRIGSPKEAKILELLEEAETPQRIVIWAAFTESIKRLTEICRSKNWHVLEISGEGFKGYSPTGQPVSKDDLLDAMDYSNPRREELLEEYEFVAVVANPLAGGQGLTFTAAPTAVYYSLSFSGVARMQSEDRIHRAGMDMNRNARIVDLLMFPTDKLVLDNLQNKKDLQALSEGDASRILNMGMQLDYD